MAESSEQNSLYKIGVVGYSATPFDKARGRELLTKLMDQAVGDRSSDEVEVVSGLTNLGIPALAYEMASDRGYRTAGVACPQAKEYECYKCDRVQIIGERWGDESDAFIKQLDILVRVGGGPQSYEEADTARVYSIPVLSENMPALELEAPVYG